MKISRPRHGQDAIAACLPRLHSSRSLTIYWQEFKLIISFICVGSQALSSSLKLHNDHPSQTNTSSDQIGYLNLINDRRYLFFQRRN